MKKNPIQKQKRELSSVFIIVFFVLFGLCFAAMLLMSLKTRGDSFLQTLFYADNSTNKDFFMDFFNSIRDAKDTDVYTTGSVNTPLACLIFFLFSHMIPQSVTETTFSQRYALQANQQSIVIFYVFIIICLVALSFILRAFFNSAKNKTLATVFSFAFLFIYPVFYCVERGNILILSMICTAFFVFFHVSENATIRNLSLLVFAFGAALKLYPIVFILILVQQKRYKDLLRTAIYFLIFFFVPAIFYHFGADLLMYFKNVAHYAQTHKQGFSLTSVSVSSLTTLLGGGKVLGEAAVIVTCVLAALGVFLVPKTWQRYALLAYILVNVRIVSSIFSLIFFLIPFAVFISADTKKRRVDWLYFALFCLILLPLPCFWYFKPEMMASLFASLHVKPILSANQLVAMPAVQLTGLFLCLEGLIRFVSHVRDGGSPLWFFGGAEKRKRKAPAQQRAGKNDVTV